MVGGGGQDDWKNKAWRGLGRFFMLGSYLQDSAAMDSMQLLSVDAAELVEEGCQDDWKTKVWRSLARFLMLGSYLLGAAAESFPQEKALLPDPGPSSYQPRQGDAELTGESGQDAWRTKAWRSLARFFMLGSYLQAFAVDTGAIGMVANAFNARRSTYLPMVREFQLKDQLATTEQELSTVEAPNRRPPMHHHSSSPPTWGSSIQQLRQQQLLSGDKVELVGKGYQDD